MYVPIIDISIIPMVTQRRMHSPLYKKCRVNLVGMGPASMHGGIIPLLPNCTQIIPATNVKRSIYILLNAIQRRIIQLSDNRRHG